MAQVSYGTITITDTNDIESIIIEYARNQSTSTAPTSGWSTERPAWADGYYIWQRARIHKSGTDASEDTFGTAVCLTGSKGDVGQTGAAGRSLTNTVTQYTTAASNATITESNMGNYTWTSNVPSYSASTPAYWVRVTNTYSNPSSTVYIIYKDNGITNAVATAHDADTKATQAQTDAGNAVTIANNANSAISDLNQYFWRKKTASTNVPAGSYVTNIPGTNYEANPANGGFNSLVQANGIYLRNGITTLSSWTGSALTFNNPSTGNAQLIIGANGVLQSGNYVYTSGTYSDSGTKIDLTTGSIYTPGFRTDGSNTYIRGEINALSGKIGNNSTNYWTIGNYYNYDQTASAALVSHGTAFIQLDTSNTWRLSTDRIHTAWNGTDNSAALMFPKDGDTYWDWGIHSPHQTNNTWKDKFVYARKYTNTINDDFTNRDNLSNDLDDDVGLWTYQFYIDKNGSIYARNFYLLNSDGTPGSNIGGQDSVYLLKTGGTITGNLEVNGTLTKGEKTVTYLTATPTNGQILIADGTSGGIKTSGYTISTTVPSGAVFTDYRVKTEARGTTTMYLAGSNTTGTVSQGTLLTDSGVYIQTSNSSTNLVVSKINGYTLAAASAKGVDTSLTTSTTSTNLPTSAAVVNLIKQYLPLTGGNVTGAVTFGSSVSVDELTAGDLVVNGNASFTNNLQVNTINGVAVGSSPKFTDTNYYHTTGSWGGTNSLTYTATANGGAGALAFTLATATTGAYGVTKLSSATDSTSTTLAATASAVKAAYDLAASKTNNTGTVTSVQVQASSPLQSSSSTASSTTLSTTISFTNQNVNTILAGPSSGTTAAAPTFRKLVVADIPDISGTYYLASNPSGYTTNTGTVTSVRVQASSPLTSTTNTASSTTLDTTIKFSNQNKNLVLAGPSSGSAAAPTFRSLVADDIPSISKSKISDFPTSLKNPNAITLNLFNETAARSGSTAQNTPTSSVTYDGSTANQSFSAAGRNAITSIGISGDTLSWVRADGSSGSSTVTITASVASGATVLTDTSGNAISTTGSTTPVWFSGGVPVDVTGIAFSLLPTGTGASNVAVGNHSHGNITNDGKITTTATIASGDKLVIVDTDSTAGSKITGSSITFGTSTTTFLTNKGTWATPVGTTYTFDGTYDASTNKAATVSTVTNAINALDGGTIGTPSASKTVTAISQTNGNISVTFGNISITKSQISDFPASMTPTVHTHTFDSLTDKPTTLSGYGITDAVQYLGVLTSLGSGTPAAATQTYWIDNIPNNTVKMAYNTSGTEYSLIFSRGGSANYGSVLKWGYNDLYFYIMRKNSSSAWKETDWVKMNAGYADDAGTVSGHSVAIDVPSTAKLTDTWNALSTSQAGYVAKAPNDTAKFLRGDASWSQVSSANLSDIALTWSSSVSTTDWILAHDTSVTDKNLFRAMSPANLKTTMSLNNVENTKLSTWTGSSNITTVGTISSGTWNGSAIPVANGGTGATTAANARTNLGLGSAATASTTTSIASGGTGLPTAGTVYTYVTNAVSGASNTYVTIATDQTITASQKTFNGAIRWGTASKYGAAHYDSTLEAIVFNFA